MIKKTASAKQLIAFHEARALNFKTLQSRLKVEVEVVAKRSLGENSQLKKLSTRTEIEEPDSNS